MCEDLFERFALWEKSREVNPTGDLGLSVGQASHLGRPPARYAR
jgi:hypothetical protein